MVTGKWNKKEVVKAIKLRNEGASIKKISYLLKRSEVGVRQKIKKLEQKDNHDKFKHTNEKRLFAKKHIKKKGIDILETHCGFGGMTEYYNTIGTVTCIDKQQDRVDFINKQYKNASAENANSEDSVIELLASKRTFDVVDIDPYGLPSRFFPYVFGLIEQGLLFLTFPRMGIAVINKYTRKNYNMFWGINIGDSSVYIQKIVFKLKEYAFINKREIDILEVVKINNMYRLAIGVSPVIKY